MATVINTSTASTATAYSTQRKVDRTSNGVLWAFYQVDGNQVGSTYYSTDNGVTWTLSGHVPNGVGLSTQNYTRNASFFIDVDDYAHLAFRDNHNGKTYYRRGTPNASRTAWTWSAATLMFAGYDYYDYSDIVAHREGTGWTVHVVGSAAANANHAVYHHSLSIASDGTVSHIGVTAIATTYGNTWHKYPSIDFNHTGDGKTIKGGTPHLYVAWSAGAAGAGKGIRFKKATYSAGSWTWSAEREIDPNRFVENTNYWLNCMFDGTRVVMAGLLRASNLDIMLYERDAADTTTTTRALATAIGFSSAATLYTGSSSYDGDGNVYFFGKSNNEAAGSNDLHYRKWTRSGASLGGIVVIDSAVGDPWVSAKRGYSSKRIEFVYTDGTASPYSVTYDSIVLNKPPTAPTVTAPNGGETWDKTHTITWNAATDPDGNPLQYHIQLTTNNGSTWTTLVALTAAGATSYSYDFSGQPETSQARIRIRAYDGSLYGPFDESNANFTISHAPPTPTNVTPSAGATVNTDLPTLGMTLTSWTAQQKGRWQLATTADFVTNMREISEPDADLKTGGATTEPLPSAAELFQGVWYIRGRAVSATGATSPWTAAHTFTVSHPPSTTTHAPTGDAVMLYDTGDVTLSWKFSDTSPTDTQTARQVIVERNSDGLVIVDTGKVATAAESVTVNIPATYKGVKLRWRVRVWDSDDVVGAYSAYHTFTLADAPTVNITAPAEGSEINTATPKVEWTFTGYGGRTQHERRVIFTHTLGGTVVHDSGWKVTTATSYTPSSTDMATGEGYTVKVEVRDTSYLYGSDSNNFTTSWVPPGSVSWDLNLGTVEDGGYVELIWNDAQKDQEWYSWQVWRRPVGGDWTMLREFRTSKPQFEYRDYKFESGTQYEWSIVEVVERFGNLVVGPVSPKSGTPSPSDYWLVYSNEEADWEKNFRLHIVVGDEFSDPYEQAETHLIGRGRHVDYGDRLGYAGVLTVEIRSQERLGVTGRDQRMRLEAFHAEKGSAFLRNPFGDLFRVASGDLQMSRLAGVGNREFGTVTIPYYEVTE